MAFWADGALSLFWGHGRGAKKQELIKNKITKVYNKGIANMSKHGKNGNYQTEKREAERLAKEAALKKEKRNKILIWTLIPAGTVIFTTLVLLMLNAFGLLGYKVTHTAKIVIEGYGTVELELYGETAPITVENFVKLAEEDYYDGTVFHRIIEGFMAQGGAGNGSAKSIKGEFWSNGVHNPIKHERGVISMARTSIPNSATSQFFIMQEAAPHLDGDYAAFGKVTKGIEVIDNLCRGRREGITYDIRILEVFVYEAGKAE